MSSSPQSGRGDARQEAGARVWPPALRLRPWVWHLVYAGARSSIAVRFRVQVVSVPATLPRGPVLLALKHVSAWDIPVATYLVRTLLHGRKAYFQMGSFIGYPVFGRLRPVLEACGGFSVMRPKEVLRLRSSGDHDRARIRALMDEVNGTAEATRRAVLAGGGVLVVFPEGTRDAAAVRPVRSTHEIESALEVAREGVRPVVVPATMSYGPPSRLRRRLDIRVAEPIVLDGLSAQDVGDRIETTFRELWRPA